MLRHRGFSFVFVLVALGLAISASPAQGQTISFLRQFAAPGFRGASAVATDTSGVYVFGSDGGARKFDARGNELWTRQFGPSEGLRVLFRGAAVDATGVYAVGRASNPDGSNAVAFVRKYDAGGNELWARQFDTSGQPYANAVAADATGVYIFGVVGGNAPGAGVFLRKYDAGGNEVWTRQFDRLYHAANGVAADASGVYVVGSTYNPPAPGGFFVRKYDADGNELWTRQSSTDAYANAVAADASGVYVAGRLEAPLRVLLRKYDAGGNELWTRQFDTSGYANAEGVAVDATGVYLVGRIGLGSLPGQCRSGSSDAFVRKYDAAGNELWTRQFGTSRLALASGVAVDATGVYVAGGAADDATGATNAFLAKFEKAPAVVPESRPRILPGCVVNAASYVGGGVAPGEIVTIFGSAMGPSQLVPLRLTEERRLATTLADTRILFNGVPAPLLYVSANQSSAIVPYAVAGRTSVDVQVEYKGIRSEVVTAPVLASRPGIFSLDSSGRGQGAILNEDGSINSPSNPAPRGSIVAIYSTGGGEADSAVVDGQILSVVLPRTRLPVSVSFGANLEDEYAEGEVLYAGGASGSVAGLLQVNVRVPSDARVGDAVPFTLFIGPHATWFQVTMALR